MLLRLLFAVFILIQLVTRSVLYGYALYLEQLDFSMSGLLEVLLLGLIPDLIVFIFFAAILSILRLFITKNISHNKLFRSLGYALYFIFVFALTFDIAAEVLFWEEFSTRFNFIAVDYLVYTREVVGNIQESYPLYTILTVIALLSVVIFAATAKFVISAMQYYTSRIRRYIYAALYTGLACGFFFLGQYINFDITDRYENELAKNGIGSLFLAYTDNSLNYQHFYQTKNNDEVFTNIRKLVKAKNQTYVSDDIYNLARVVKPTGTTHKYNIMLLSVESLSADYMQNFGSEKKLTPNLDALISSSLVFDRYFAAGTRTVRGLEAMTLALPPTPGNAILRRPKNENLFSIGSVLRDFDYDNKFLYGGYGYFDNMNYFFENNSFAVLDRTSIDKKDVVFENIWGVADEVLFDKALQEADKSYKSGRPFFSLIMTTSNHRPYTYPDNRVEIASGTGREGAVQYTDYAIGKFLRDARTKKWFDNTIFIITADHCAASAGKQDLPISKYHIPLIIYAPEIIKPGIYTHYMSQIDLAPTILGMLNLAYTSKFFGNDALLEPKERVFISTYQKLGFFKNHLLTVLGPKKQADMYEIDAKFDARPAATNETTLDEAIYYYQGANYSFDKGLMRE